MNKKSIPLFVLTLFLVLPLIANADIDVSNILTNIINVLWTIFDGIVVIVFIIAGIKYLTARGDPGKIQEANKAIIWGLVGVVVGVLANSAQGLIRKFLNL